MQRLWWGILKSLRPHQWVKNVFVLAPWVFSGQMLDVPTAWRALTAAALFCAVSGAVYLVNDAADVEQDRLHPVKRHRPIAAGIVPAPLAKRLAWGLGLVALGAAAFVSPWLTAVLVTYLLVNLAYSSRLKHVAWVDVGVIATGFLLRVLAGGVATGVHISVWLLACTFLLALYLGLGKRRHELLAAGDGARAQRGVLASYRVEHTTGAMLGTALATAAAYTAYATSPHAAELFGLSRGWWTVPMIVVGLTRFFTLSSMSEDPSSPTDRMIRDPLFLFNIAAWGLLVLVLLYALP